MFCSQSQWENGIPDGSAHNVVRGNTLTPYGNECVDIKEGAYDNIVEDNVCREQYDDDAGCYGSRGDDNIFRCVDLKSQRGLTVCTSIYLVEVVDSSLPSHYIEKQFVLRTEVVAAVSQ